MEAPGCNGGDADDKDRGIAAGGVPVSGDPVEKLGSLGHTAADHVQFAEDEHGDSTEYSSSFGASCSGPDDDALSDKNGIEVDSPFLGNDNVDGTTSDPNILRHKQVTAEWRKTVRPLIWRCQWLQLRMKDLASQVAKYDKELALINRQKELQLEMLKVDGSNSELGKQDIQSQNENTMKRRKRKRLEETVDTSLYMKNHPIFSYYNERKKSGAEDGLLINDGSKSVVVEDLKSGAADNTLLSSHENDRVLEQYSLREVLLRIDGIQSQISRLQDHLIKARSKRKMPQSAVNQTQFKKPRKNQKAAAESSALPDRLTNTAQEGATLLGANKITFQELFGAHAPLIYAHAKELYKESDDDVLIDNQEARDEWYGQLEQITYPANRVANTPLNQEVKTLVTPVVKHELVQETAQIVKQVDKSEESPVASAEKKSEVSLHDSNDETPALAAANPRRSQRVRKPKLMD